MSKAKNKATIADLEKRLDAVARVLLRLDFPLSNGVAEYYDDRGMPDALIDMELAFGWLEVDRHGDHYITERHPIPQCSQDTLRGAPTGA